MTAPASFWRITRGWAAQLNGQSAGQDLCNSSIELNNMLHREWITSTG